MSDHTHDAHHIDDTHHPDDKKPWVERNWYVLVVAFGLIAVAWIDLFAPSL